MSGIWEGSEGKSSWLCRLLGESRRKSKESAVEVKS